MHWKTHVRVFTETLFSTVKKNSLIVPQGKDEKWRVIFTIRYYTEVKMSELDISSHDQHR